MLAARSCGNVGPRAMRGLPLRLNYHNLRRINENLPFSCRSALRMCHTHQGNQTSRSTWLANIKQFYSTSFRVILFIVAAFYGLSYLKTKGNQMPNWAEEAEKIAQKKSFTLPDGRVVKYLVAGSGPTVVINSTTCESTLSLTLLSELWESFSPDAKLFSWS